LGEPSTIREIGIGIDLVTKIKIKTYLIIKTRIDPLTNIETKIEVKTNTAKVKEVVSLANLAFGQDYVAQDSTLASQQTLNDQGMTDMIE
jgi:hypothetical protein